MQSWKPMSQSEKKAGRAGGEARARPVGKKPLARRGIRRPLVFLALLWIFFLLLCRVQGLPLRQASAVEKRLAREEDERLHGLINGTIRDISINTGGNYSILLSRAVFTPQETDERLSAGTVLVYFPVRTDLKAGNTVLFEGELSFFREADNPGGFDAKAYYLALDMACFMEAEAVRMINAKCDFLRDAAAKLRLWVSRSLESLYAPEEAGILCSMLLGERNSVSDETEALYEAAGLSHLLSVSGLHIGFWALVLGRFFGFLLSLFPFSRGRSRSSRYGFSLLKGILTGVMIAFYMLVSGGRVPVRRAGLMVLLGQLARGLRLSFDLPSAIALAALTILIPYPYSLFQSSFLLSFGCILLIGCILPWICGKLRTEHLMTRDLLVPALLQFGMLPLSLHFTYLLHPYSAGANLVALPLVSLILGGASFSCLLGLFWRPAALIAAGGVHTLLEGIRRLCLGIKALPFHSLILGRPPALRTGIYLLLAATGFALMIRIRRKEEALLALSLTETEQKKKSRAWRESVQTVLPLSAWMLACTLVFLPHRLGGLHLTSLYVGQGDCHVLELPDGRCYLIDGGSSYGNPAEKSILPYLKYRGIRSLDYILVSHLDADHINALPDLILSDQLRVKGLILPAAYRGSPRGAELLAAAKAAQTEVIYAGEGALWQDGETRFAILFPPDEAQRDPDNESSLILRLDWRDFSALFTGDLGEEGEQKLLRICPDQIRQIDCLKVGHHGSRYSSSAAFLSLVSPRYALISCGRNNLYGHPAAAALNRLKMAGASVFRTDQDGAVQLSVLADGSVRTEIMHRKEHSSLMENEEKITHSTWISCGIVLAAGILAAVFAFLGPKKTEAVPHASSGTQASFNGTETDGPPDALPSQSPYYEPRTVEAETWPVTAPARAETVPFSELPKRNYEENAGRIAAGEDPLAPGFYFSLELTDYLYTLFASDFSNNTREEDPFRGISAALKEKADLLAEQFAKGAASASETASLLQGESFIWPQDPLQLRHDVGAASANVYAFSGGDMTLARERILLTNRAGRHYLFIRVYRNADADAVRIYMVNALIY